jgi:uncharacterized RDD family membrane protein YckC
MASADYRVVTPERVSLEYGIAGIGSRGAAIIVDTLLQAVCLLVVGLALAAGVAILGEPSQGTAVAVFAAFGLAVFVVANGYFMLFEIIWNGQTPGKRLVGLRVLREDGYPIRSVDSVVRNLVRIVDWLPLLYSIGVLVMLLNRRSRRLGDFAGGTIVVREGGRGGWPVVAPTATDAAVTLGEAPRGYALSGADATLVRDFLVRREAMDPAARGDLARRLASVLARRYHLSFTPGSDPEHFLEQLT